MRCFGKWWYPDWGGSATIFLLVSAWLYGSKWHKDGFKSFDTFEFLKKRCLRIFLPLWILLLGGILCEYYIVGRFEVMTIAMNAVGLGWAKPFGTAGHLWYITMVLILYASFLLLSTSSLSHIYTLKILWAAVFSAGVVARLEQ